MKNFCLSTLLILFSTLGYAQEPATVTLVASKNCNKTTELIVDLDGVFTTEPWNNDHLRIVMEIKTIDANGLSTASAFVQARECRTAHCAEH